MSQPDKQQDLLPADAQSQTIALINVIERAAHSPDMDVEKMERLLAMHERIVAKNAEISFNDAMNQSQSEIGRIAADAENKQTNSRYATYAALDRVLRPIYTKHGFSLSFDSGEAPENTVTILCYVSHKDGHTRTYRANIPADGKGAKGGDVMTKTHAVGSGMQYGQRYLLKLIFNVAIGVDDDDGNAAGIEYITEEQTANLTALLEEVGIRMNWGAGATWCSRPRTRAAWTDDGAAGGVGVARPGRDAGHRGGLRARPGPHEREAIDGGCGATGPARRR